MTRVSRYGSAPNGAQLPENYLRVLGNLRLGEERLGQVAPLLLLEEKLRG